jgi:hypothetical protein
MTQDCKCPEGRYLDKTGKERKVPAQHNCDYIARRNSMIPEAERRANAATKAERGTLLHSQAWSRAFFAAVNELMEAV